VVKSDRDELIEFAEAIARGETFDEPEPDEMRQFQKMLSGSFGNFNE
jgi:hypothetical protein